MGFINYKSNLLNQKDKKEIFKWLIKNYNDEKVKEKQIIKAQVLDILNNVMQNYQYSNKVFWDALISIYIQVLFCF